jgi:hypothetical protein
MLATPCVYLRRGLHLNTNSNADDAVLEAKEQSLGTKDIHGLGAVEVCGVARYCGKSLFERHWRFEAEWGHRSGKCVAWAATKG